jgi:N-acetyl-anhydromuramyl-L-alanine amidase AmpD
MAAVNGIIVHQTGGATAQSAFNAYLAGATGAHLLIDVDGTIYQTARLDQVTWHVGKLQARCVAEFKCAKPKKWDPSGVHKAEMAKPWPSRYPSNNDSIGIEIVGGFNSKINAYDTVNERQNTSLKWLISELTITLKISATEVFRHPTVSYKQPSEAATAKW